MKKIIIATITKYRSEQETRALQCLRLLREVRRNNYRIIMVDAGSPENFVQKCQKLGAMVFPQATNTMGGGRREVFQKAGEMIDIGDAILWTEPEKYTAIKYFSKITKPIISGRADFIAGERKNLNTYPMEQQYLEKTVALAYEYITGQKVDLGFGICAFNLVALKFFLDYHGDYGDKWDSLLVPRLRILKAGLRMENIKVPYKHPRIQTLQETGDMDFFMKRIEQLNNVISPLYEEAIKLGLYPRK